MKILCSMRHPALIRDFETMLCRLAERGHNVHVASDGNATVGDEALMRELSTRWPSLSFGPGPCHKSVAQHSKPFIWKDLAQHARAALDYLHVQQPPFAEATGLRRRLETRTPRAVVRADRIARAGGAAGTWVLHMAIRSMERAMPWNRDVESFLARHQPDVLLVSPLIWPASPHVDYVRGARALGIANVMCVSRWDNLTTKGALYELPDLITVWNDTQKQELIQLHAVPAAQIVVVGAHPYDHWFDWPARSRQAFCDRTGLAADRPFVLYVCSARSVAPFEVAFVKSWIARVRGADQPGLREIGVLIRPHPENSQRWQELGASLLDNVVVWPPEGANPVLHPAKADYFDSLYHSAAVVGVNTSAFIEAGIVGRPVLSLLSEEFADAQERTIHFQSLVSANGNLVRVARDLDTHLDQLAAAVSSSSAASPANQAFICSFVRPIGVDRPASVQAVTALEHWIDGRHPQLGARRRWSHLLRPALFPLAIRTAVAAFAERHRSEMSRGAAYRHVLFHPSAGLYPLTNIRAAGGRILDGVYASATVRSFTRKHLAPRARTKAPAVPAAGPTARLVESSEANPQRLVESALTSVLSIDGRPAPDGGAESPIVVGPFLGEVGFELLYWIPFVRWAVQRLGLDRRKLIAVSRGGTSAWYQGLCGGYYEVFDDYTLDDCFRRHVEQAGPFLKQMEIGAFDREIVARLQHTRAIAHVKTLHPSLMYRAFAPFWRKQAPISLVESMTAHQRMPAHAASAPIDDHLPREYVAVKFYASESFPNVPANRALAEEIVSRLAEQSHVVLLETGLRVDNHVDFPISPHGRVTRINRLISPANNLAVQTRIISGARAFVGTFGGFSFLAALCGVNAVALYSHPELFRAHHLDVAWRIFRNVQGGAFVPVDTAHLDLLQEVLQRSAAVGSSPAQSGAGGGSGLSASSIGAASAVTDLRGNFAGSEARTERQGHLVRGSL